MATLKMKEIKNMSANDREKKLKELEMELVKSRSGSAKGGKTKEIKKIIARMLTLNKLATRQETGGSKEVGKNK